MKILLIILFAVLHTAISAFGANSPPTSLATAVFDVEAATPTLKDRVAQFSPLLFAALANQSNLLLVERTQLGSALGELSLGASGLVDASTATSVGRLTGAKVLITSKAIGTATDATIIAKIIGTETGRVFACTKKLESENDMKAAGELADQIAGLMSLHSSDLISVREDSAMRESRLRSVVSGKSLPKLTISIPEQHLTHAVRDPAAETEISRTLGALGFSVFDLSSQENVSVRITGEAISEAAMRHGDFISCRGRVEVKVVEIATGKILLQDRQTEVAADISEAVAAKTALQNAAAKLAERIVTALVASPSSH